MDPRLFNNRNLFESLLIKDPLGSTSPFYEIINGKKEKWIVSRTKNHENKFNDYCVYYNLESNFLHNIDLYKYESFGLFQNLFVSALIFDARYNKNINEFDSMEMIKWFHPYNRIKSCLINKSVKMNNDFWNFIFDNYISVIKTNLVKVPTFIITPEPEFFGVRSCRSDKEFGFGFRSGLVKLCEVNNITS